ncbi:hypothetical protein [Limisphaera sp. 4302-co]|uniref:hypothetical protein n=1 Tax=Limisphaera sp. 4302-co TaxID=3400417 RepID=UPI003C1A23AD
MPKAQFQNSVPTPTRNRERFHVHPACWKNPREALFFLEARQTYTIRPDTDRDLPMHLQMAVETHSWNPIPPNKRPRRIRHARATDHLL